MDFYTIVIADKKDGTLQVRPDWKVGRYEDLMTRGGSFYAIWDEARGLWSTDIYDVQRLVDQDLMEFAKKHEEDIGLPVKVARLAVNSTKLWNDFQTLLHNSGNNHHPLDEKLIFADQTVTKKDYASRKPVSYTHLTLPTNREV